MITVRSTLPAPIQKPDAIARRMPRLQHFEVAFGDAHEQVLLGELELLLGEVGLQLALFVGGHVGLAHDGLGEGEVDVARAVDALAGVGAGGVVVELRRGGDAHGGLQQCPALSALLAQRSSA